MEERKKNWRQEDDVEVLNVDKSHALFVCRCYSADGNCLPCLLSGSL